MEPNSRRPEPITPAWTSQTLQLNWRRNGSSYSIFRESFQTADAENLEFADDSFDLVYSHGVLHHTPDTEGAVREIYRVLRPGGRAVVMLYHRDSYNYRVNISVLRRAGAQLLRWDAGISLVHRLTGESVESLRQHAIATPRTISTAISSLTSS